MAEVSSPYELCTLAEGLDPEEHVIVTYWVQASTQTDMLAKAVALAVEQSSGTWTDVPYETEELKTRYAAKVVGIYGAPDHELIATLPTDDGQRDYILRVAFPWHNFGDNLPMMLSSVIGNVSSMPYLKVLDIDFPRAFAERFQGPKFGIAGIREYLGVFGRPLLNSMIKPCTGFPPEVGAELLYQAAAGGTDWIKDDELLAPDIAICPLDERVRQYMKAASRADKEKSGKTLYTVNITAAPGKLKENARRALDAGANALMVNVAAIGLGALRDLAEAPNITVPLMAHTCFQGTMSSSPHSGVASALAAKLARLAGADLYLNVAPSAKFNALREKFLQIHHALIRPFYHLKPTFPLVGGGVHPGMVPYLIELVGTDFVAGAGGAVHGHPQGSRAGAKAMRDAIDAACRGEDLFEAAKKSEELQMALDKWGIYSETDFARLYTIDS